MRVIFDFEEQLSDLEDKVWKQVEPEIEGMIRQKLKECIKEYLDRDFYNFVKDYIDSFVVDVFNESSFWEFFVKQLAERLADLLNDKISRW